VKKLTDNLALLSLTLWVGGLWTMGYMVAPTLFAVLHDNKQMAGMLAGRMFQVIAYVGMGCGVYLLLFRLSRYGASALKQAFFWAALTMLLLTIGSHFGIQPIMESLKAQAMPQEVMKSMFADRFSTWHGISSIVYLVESLLGVVLVLKHGKA
jgi:high-affinity Fe2+/Pb2+ permease